MEGGCTKAHTATAQYRPVPAPIPTPMSRAYSFDADAAADADVVAEDTNICQLQELGISPAYAESLLRMTRGDINEAAALAFSDWTAGAAAAVGDDSPPLSYAHPHPPVKRGAKPFWEFAV